MDVIEKLVKEIAEKSHVFVHHYVSKSLNMNNLSDSVRKIVLDSCEVTLMSYLLLQVVKKVQNTNFFEE